jgi:hypothetical protein
MAGVTVGMPFTSQFTYDTDTPWSNHWGDDNSEGAIYEIKRKYMLKLTVGPHEFKATSASAYVSSGEMNQQLDVFSISGGGRMNGVSCYHDSCYFGITLVASPDHADALDSVQLPAVLTRSKFDREHYASVHINGGQPTIHLDVESIKSTLCVNGTDPRTACND